MPQRISIQVFRTRFRKEALVLIEKQGLKLKADENERAITALGEELLRYCIFHAQQSGSRLPARARKSIETHSLAIMDALQTGGRSDRRRDRIKKRSQHLLIAMNSLRVAVECVTQGIDWSKLVATLENNPETIDIAVLLRLTEIFHTESRRSGGPNRPRQLEFVTILAVWFRKWRKGPGWSRGADGTGRGPFRAFVLEALDACGDTRRPSDETLFNAVNTARERLKPPPKTLPTAPSDMIAN